MRSEAEIAEIIARGKLYERQREVVELCLQESFAQYADVMLLTDAFFQRLAVSTDAYKTFADFEEKNSNPEDETYKSLKEAVNQADEAIIRSIQMEDGSDIFNKMQEDLKVMGKQNVSWHIQQRRAIFLNLLKSRVQYMKETSSQRQKVPSVIERFYTTCVALLK